jgi:predicted amidohydrolase
MSVLGTHVAIAQLELHPGAVDENRTRIVDAIRSAADRGANLVVLPELASSGYKLDELLHRRLHLRSRLP